jgi:hypothetical protein
MKPEMRQQLARLPFEEKIRKVSELIRLSRKIKSCSDDALLARLDKAAAELNTGQGVTLEHVREKIRGWAGK